MPTFAPIDSLRGIMRRFYATPVPRTQLIVLHEGIKAGIFDQELIFSLIPLYHLGNEDFIGNILDGKTVNPDFILNCETAISEFLRIAKNIPNSPDVLGNISFASFYGGIFSLARGNNIEASQLFAKAEPLWGTNSKELEQAASAGLDQAITLINAKAKHKWGHIKNTVDSHKIAQPSMPIINPPVVPEPHQPVQTQKSTSQVKPEESIESQIAKIQSAIETANANREETSKRNDLYELVKIYLQRIESEPSIQVKRALIGALAAIKGKDFHSNNIVATLILIKEKYITDAGLVADLELARNCLKTMFYNAQTNWERARYNYLLAYFNYRIKNYDEALSLLNKFTYDHPYIAGGLKLTLTIYKLRHDWENALNLLESERVKDILDTEYVSQQIKIFFKVKDESGCRPKANKIDFNRLFSSLRIVYKTNLAVLPEPLKEIFIERRLTGPAVGLDEQINNRLLLIEDYIRQKFGSERTLKKAQRTKYINSKVLFPGGEETLKRWAEAFIKYFELEP